MELREHLILGGLAAGALAPVIGPERSLFFFGASVLLDVDHYWQYVEMTGWRDWSVRRMFAFHHHVFPLIHRSDFVAVNTFHTVEAFLLVYLLGLQLESGIVLAIFWGGLFHLVLDVSRLAWQGAPFARAYSILEYAIRRRRLLARGIDPERMLAECARRVVRGLPVLPGGPVSGSGGPERPEPRRPAKGTQLEAQVEPARS